MIIVLFISLAICTLANFQVKAQSATIWTDKADYHPGENVTLYGTGFLPNANVAINVTKQSDGTVSSFNAISDPNGNFTTSYQIGNVGATLYDVIATDGANSATTTFTDSTFGIDTNCEGFGSISSSQSVPITTTSMTAQANELIIIVITQGSSGHRIFEHFTITDSFSSHLSYTQRGTTLRSGRNAEAISEYYAVTSSSQTGPFKITVTPSRYNHKNIDVQVFGILGANTASPFDPHSGLPYKGYSTGSSIPTVTGVSTSNANDIILGLEGNSGSTAETAGPYFTGTILNNVNSEGDNVGYKTVTSTLSTSSIAFGTPVTNWVMYVDAVRQALSVSVSPTSWTMDMGQSKTFTATASGGSGSYTSYQWYVNGLLAQSGTASVMPFTPGSSGTYTITVTVTDSLGATSAQSSAATVTVATSPTVSIAPVGPLTMDAGQIQTFTATASGGSGTINYQWHLDGSAVGTNTASYSYTASGTSYTVSCKVTDSASTPVISPASNTVTITVNSALVAPTVTPTPGTVDQGQASSLTSTAVTTGTSPYTYQWLEKAPGESYVTVGSNSGSFSFATSGSTATGSWSFILQVTDNTGVAVNSTAVSVTVNPAPTVSIAPVGPVTLDAGQAQTFTASASGGTGTLTYQWSLNDSPVGSNSNTYIFSESAGSYSITCTVTDSASEPASAASNAVSVTVNQLTITVTQSANGVIAPGTIPVNYGSSQTFTITPNTGYSIASLTVDGSPVTTASSYTFSNIEASHTITATFAINTYTITVTQGANGVIAPGTTTVNYGATPSFSITPNTGYHIASLTANGASVTVTTPSGQTYQFSAVSADGSLTATFAITSTTPTASPTPSPTPTVSPIPTSTESTPSPTPKGSSPTPTVSSPSPTPTVSPTKSPTPTVSPKPSPTPLYLVLAAVIIVAAFIILIFSVLAVKRRRRKPDSTLPNSEDKYKKTDALAPNAKQEIASIKGTIEKIRNLEAEKKNLLLEIAELKKKADAKAAFSQ